MTPVTAKISSGHIHSKLVLKGNMPSDHFLAQRQHDLEGLQKENKVLQI